MADKVVVKAEKREGRGKNDSRRLRRDGKVPVVVYGGEGESVAAVAELSDLAAILRSDAGYNTVFTLDMAGEGTGDVMFQDRQIDALKGRLVHADLRRLSKGEKIEVTVSIHLIGEAAGLDEEGAVLNQQLREVKVLCEPRNIPEFLEVDVTNLEANGAVYVSDISVGKGIEIHESPETVVASIVMVREEELEPQLDVFEPEVTEESGGDKPGAITGEGDTDQP